MGLLNKKEKIVLAAISEFAKEGFEKASVDTIALKAKVAKGTVFYHFKSKERLFEKIVDEGQRRFEEKIGKEIKKIKTNKNKIERIIEIEIDFIHKYKDLFLVYLEDTIKRVDSIKIIDKVLSDGIDKGEFRKDLNVRTISVALFWMTAMTCLNSEGLDPEQIKGLVLKGIKK